jgi:hypothetical protein
MNLTREQMKRLKYLKERIIKNTAPLSEYDEYEKLILISGFTHDDIQKYLDREHISSYEELLRERSRYRDRKRNAEVETIIVAGLVGLGMAVILKSLFNK